MDINEVVGWLNGIFFSNVTVYVLLATGVLFTVWSGFGQYRALTHGVAVVRGKFDKKGDPGAISHFQALSAALSATVGLGNIGGVATAVAIGGPGAVFWMWIIGVLGMSLKMTEVTQSMLHRNIDDPENPHGGPMFVVDTLFKKHGGKLGATFGGLFCLTLILSAITGGNMFQAWNVAEVTSKYFDVPGVSQIPVEENFNAETLAIGIALAIIVLAVIVGGIKSIGRVAGLLVPFMCVLYFAVGVTVLGMNVTVIPEMVMLIIREGLGIGDSNPAGAFLGGSFGMAVLWGVKRALFSSEAGQGSAPIAHSAARCDEPVREGVVAGLEPFIDTIVVCTVTALVILSTDAWNREGETILPEDGVRVVQSDAGWTLESDGNLPFKTEDARRISMVAEGSSGWNANDSVFMILRPIEEDREWLAANNRGLEAKNFVRIDGTVRDPQATEPSEDGDGDAASAPGTDDAGGDPIDDAAAALAEAAEGAQDALGGALDEAAETGGDILDELGLGEAEPPAGEQDADPPESEPESELGSEPETSDVAAAEPVEPLRRSELFIEWGTLNATYRTDDQGNDLVDEPIRYELVSREVYHDYPSAALTAHAFDRAFDGWSPIAGLSMGGLLIVVASWLFAISTMISWSYYGEQGIIYLFGTDTAGKTAVNVYRVVYCVLIAVSTIGFIKTDQQLDMWTTLGLGAMLVVNIPIMWIFGFQAMKAYHTYIRKLKDGWFDPDGPNTGGPGGPAGPGGA
ncbi:MAG: amino acid carrier protein [Planctomycetota bacterium]